LTPKKLMKKSFQSQYPMSRALAILQFEARNDPRMEEMVKAVFAVYWKHTYPNSKGSFSSFIRKTERRKT